MHATDAKPLGAMLEAVMAMHGKDLTPSMFDIWWESLKRFELVDIRRALSIHVQNPDSGQFAPKPADVIRYLNGNTGTQALQAWSKVEKAIRQVGPYQTVTFDDPIIHAVINDMGGWIMVCEGTEDELPFKAREFERRYQGYALNPPNEYPKALTGIAEADNQRSGFKIPPPVLIGSESKAINCYKRGGNATGLPVKRPRSIAEILGHEPEEACRGEKSFAPTQLPMAPVRSEPFRSDPSHRQRLKAELDAILQDKGPGDEEPEPEPVQTGVSA